MGGKWSKFSGWSTVRERMRRAEPKAEPAAVGVGKASRDLEKYGAVSSSNTAATNADVAWLEAQAEEEEEVGFPVRPQVPLRPMTYKGALDLSHFLKRKGGTGRVSLVPKKARHPRSVGLPHTRLLP
uniref:Protein Nef n=1 Tax=Human immunodeficiency virus type 1 TaxID=11676 RepID=F7J900_HV1|nr:nef protein [Human immunodeficiency virus 1]